MLCGHVVGRAKQKREAEEEQRRHWICLYRMRPNNNSIAVKLTSASGALDGISSIPLST